MNYHQAQAILTEVRHGADYSLVMINTALELTGDIDGHGTFQRLRSARVDREIQEAAIGRRTWGGDRMVARNLV